MPPHPDADSGDEGVPPLTDASDADGLGENVKDLDLDEDNDDDDNDEDDDNLMWNSGMAKCKDLFSDAEFDSAQECLDHCQSQHNFDIKVMICHKSSSRAVSI